MTLFQGESLQTFLESRLQSAGNAIDRLSLSDLRDPALAGRIERLWASTRAAIPLLQRDGKSGKMREVTERRTDYDREVAVQTTVVDVQVPYRGDGEMFHVRPSTSSMLNERVEVRDAHLHYTMPLDPVQEPRFDKMLDQIERNLATLRTEEENFSRHAIESLGKIAENRKKKLEGENKAASEFSFKVE